MVELQNQMEWLTCPFMGVKPNNTKANKNRVPVSKYTCIVRVLFMKPTCIDEHVGWNSNPRLQFIVCRPRKANFPFPFPFAASKRKFAVSIFRLQHTNRSCHFPLGPFPFAVKTFIISKFICNKKTSWKMLIFTSTVRKSWLKSLLRINCGIINFDTCKHCYV